MKPLAILAAASLVGPAAAATYTYDFQLESEAFINVLDFATGAEDRIVMDGRALGLTGPFADLAFGDTMSASITTDDAGFVTDCRFGTRSCRRIVGSTFTDAATWEIDTLYDVISFKNGSLVYTEDESGFTDGWSWMAARATFSDANAASVERLSDVVVMPVPASGLLLLGATSFLLWRRRG